VRGEERVTSFNDICAIFHGEIFKILAARLAHSKRPLLFLKAFVENSGSDLLIFPRR